MRPSLRTWLACTIAVDRDDCRSAARSRSTARPGSSVERHPTAIHRHRGAVVGHEWREDPVAGHLVEGAVADQHLLVRRVGTRDRHRPDRSHRSPRRRSSSGPPGSSSCDGGGRQVLATLDQRVVRAALVEPAELPEPEVHERDHQRQDEQVRQDPPRLPEEGIVGGGALTGVRVRAAPVPGANPGPHGEKDVLERETRPHRGHQAAPWRGVGRAGTSAAPAAP